MAEVANPYLVVGVRFLVGYRRTGSEDGAGGGISLGVGVGATGDVDGDGGGTTLGVDRGCGTEGMSGSSTLGDGNGSACVAETGLGGNLGRRNEGGVGGGGGKGGIGGNTWTGTDGGGIELVLAPQSRAEQSLGASGAGTERLAGCFEDVARLRSLAMSV